MNSPPKVLAASIGIPDTLLLMLLALMVFGPRRLPEIARQIGKVIAEFRRISNDFKVQMEDELRTSKEAEDKKKIKTTPLGLTVERDLPASSDGTGKPGAEAHPEAMSGTGREVNHA